MKNTEYWLQLQQITDHNRWLDQASIRYDIIEQVFKNLNINPQIILFSHFNPLVLLLEKKYQCVVVADQSIKYAWLSNSEFIDKLTDIEQPADVCIALDEYFTFARDEIDQRNMLAEIRAVTRGYLITTLQDYKNAAPHKRSQADANISQQNPNFIIIDHQILNINNRQGWQSYTYMIENQNNLSVIGPQDRRTMYFKQLANYSSSIGGTGFTIHKNLLYRGFFKKTYEHIISVQF